MNNTFEYTAYNGNGQVCYWDIKSENSIAILRDIFASDKTICLIVVAEADKDKPWLVGYDKVWTRKMIKVN